MTAEPNTRLPTRGLRLRHVIVLQQHSPVNFIAALHPADAPSRAVAWDVDLLVRSLFFAD